jgi:hypothetical protein
MSTLIGVLGCAESHAQPEMKLQLALSWKPPTVMTHAAALPEKRFNEDPMRKATSKSALTCLRAARELVGTLDVAITLHLL